MSERFAGDITIGGAVPRSLVPEFCRVIADSGAGPDYEGGCEPSTEEELLQLVGEDGTLVLHDCQARYGEFPELEGFLVSHGIPFDRSSEAKYEYDGEIVKFRPGHGTYHMSATQEGEATISASEIEGIVKRLDEIEGMRKDQLLAVAESVRDDLRSLMAMDVPPVPRFETVEG